MVVSLSSILRQRSLVAGRLAVVTRRSASTAVLRSTSAMSTHHMTNMRMAQAQTQIQQNQHQHQHQNFQGQQFQYYHATCQVSEEDKKEAEAAAPAEGEAIPEWENPLHHDNPDTNKMFEEDFKEGEEMPTNPLPPFETDADKVVAPPHIKELADKIVNLSLLELKELTDKIADHYDFDDEMMAASYSAGIVAGGGAAGGAAAEEDAPEEKTIFDLKLLGFDAKAKIKVIKEIRAIAGLGLKEAKELVESAPKVVQKDLKQDKADELKAQLEAVGAEVEIV